MLRTWYDDYREADEVADAQRDALELIAAADAALEDYRGEARG